MLTREELMKWFDYNPKTGLFAARCARGVRKKGAVSNTRANGYVVITVSGRRYSAHRLAWLCMTGRWPTAEIDHINGDRADNRFANLREATASQNRVNTRRKYVSNSGVRGVFWHKRWRKWQVEISVNRRGRYFGRYDSLEEAAKVAASARQTLFGEFCPVALLECRASA